MNTHVLFLCEDKRLFWSDNGIAVIPQIGETVLIEKVEYIVEDRIFEYTVGNSMKFCKVWIYLKRV